MEKILYLVRHCQAEGQAPDARLTEEGKKQAEELVRFFDSKEIRHIISSPFTRAIDSVEPLADHLDLKIQIDDRLAERVLSSEDLPDWMERLEESFSDLDLKFAGGESGREATNRGVEVLAASPDKTILVTHGNMMGLFLKRIDESYSFEEWKKLSNPDVYEVKAVNGNTNVTRVWGATYK